MSEELLVSRIEDLKAQEVQMRKGRQRLESDLRDLRAKKTLKEAEGSIKCPNCEKNVSQLELDENRGVCGLCYEFFASNGRGMDPEDPEEAED